MVVMLGQPIQYHFGRCCQCAVKYLHALAHRRSYQIINKWICINFRLIVFHKSNWIMSEYVDCGCVCAFAIHARGCAFIIQNRVHPSLHRYFVVHAPWAMGHLYWEASNTTYMTTRIEKFLSNSIYRFDFFFKIINWIRNRIENVNYLKCHHGSSDDTQRDSLLMRTRRSLSTIDQSKNNCWWVWTLGMTWHRHTSGARVIHESEITVHETILSLICGWKL